MNVIFDTHEQVKRLRAAGFDEHQAEAVTQALVTATGSVDLSNLATKAQVADLAANFESRMAGMEGRIVGMEGRMATKSDLLGLQWRMTALVLSAVIINASVAVGTMLGLAKLLGH